MSRTFKTTLQSDTVSDSGSTSSFTSSQCSSVGDSNLSDERIQRYLEEPQTTRFYSLLSPQQTCAAPTHLIQPATTFHPFPYVSHNLQPTMYAPDQPYQYYYPNDTPSNHTTYAQEHGHVNTYHNTTEICTTSTEAPAAFNQSFYITAHPATSHCNTHLVTYPTQTHPLNYTSQTTQSSHSFVPTSTNFPVQPGSFTCASDATQPSQTSNTTHPYQFPSPAYATHSHNDSYTATATTHPTYPESVVQAVYDMRAQLRDFDETFNRPHHQ